MDLFGSNLNNQSVGTSTATGNIAAPSTSGLDMFDPNAYNLGSRKEAKLEKFSNILESGGQLKPGQEAKLGNISAKTGIDFSGMFGLNNQAAPAMGGLQSANTGMVENPWEASSGDLYQNLTGYQEKKFDKLSDLYASGAELKPKQLNKLDKFLGLGGLGTRESYFAQPTYSLETPEDFLGGKANMTYEDLANLYRTADPLTIFAASKQLGITPEVFKTAMGGYSPSYYNQPVLQSDIESKLYAGEQDFSNLQLASAFYKDPQNAMFNDPAVRARAEAALYAYQNPIQAPQTALTTNKRGEEIAGSGQYGTYNNAPILNATVFDQLLGDRNKVGGDALKSDLLNQLGWNFKSGEDLNFMQKGVDVLGLKSKMFTPETLKAMDAPAQGEEESYLPLRQQLEGAAQKVGIDPSAYKSSSELYSALENATQGLYQVVGQYKNQWGDEASQIVDPKTGAVDKGNHASVIYKNVNGQLIPVAADLFKYEKPSEPLIRGTVGEILGGMPFLPEIVGAATGNPALYAALKTGQTASQTGDLGDIAASAAISYFAPTVAKEISATIGSYLPTEFVQSSPILADYVTKAGTNIAMDLATSKLLGRDIDIGDMVTNTLMASAIATGTGQALKLTDFPAAMQNVITQLVTRVAMGEDLQKAITSTITRVGMQGLKQASGATAQGST